MAKTIRVSDAAHLALKRCAVERGCSVGSLVEGYAGQLGAGVTPYPVKAPAVIGPESATPALSTKSEPVSGALAEFRAKAFTGPFSKAAQMGKKVLALCLLVPALAGAQPLVVAKADVAGLGAEYLLPAELDGDAATREFLQWRIGTAGETLMRAGRIGADGAVCLGEYYDPWQDAWAVLPRPIPEAHGGFHGGVYDVGGGRLKFLAQSAVVYMELDIMTAAGPHLAAPLAFGCR